MDPKLEAAVADLLRAATLSEVLRARLRIAEIVVDEYAAEQAQRRSAVLPSSAWAIAERLTHPGR